jgi:hypothetical protein
MQTLIDVIRRGSWGERLKVTWLFLLLTGGWAIIGLARWWVEG